MEYLDNISSVPDSFFPNKKRIIELQELIVNQISLLTQIIDKYGEVRGITKDPDKIVPDDYFLDFLLFALTKSCKSFLSASILCENFCQEDAQIILRSNYEIYLALSYVIKFPDSLNHYIKSLGVSLGEIEHPKSNKGRIQKNKIINPYSGKIESFGLSISTLLTGVDSEFEKKIHDFLYPYLCEHTHLNMISSGNYRSVDQSKYVYFSFEGYDIPIVYLEYILILFLDLLENKIKFDDKRLTKEISKKNQIGKKTLIKHLKDFITSDNQKDKIELIIKRLNEKK